jgi:hypothetical protein
MTVGDPVIVTPVQLATSGIMAMYPGSAVWEIKWIMCGAAYEIHLTDKTWNGSSLSGGTYDITLPISGSAAEVLMSLKDWLGASNGWFYIKNLGSTAYFTFAYMVRK